MEDIIVPVGRSVPTVRLRISYLLTYVLAYSIYKIYCKTKKIFTRFTKSIQLRNTVGILVQYPVR